MDAKITLSFDEAVISKAKAFADSQNISLSRLTEYLYSRVINGGYNNLEELPVADWVNTVAEGKIEYRIKKRSRKELKSKFFSKK